MVFCRSQRGEKSSPRLFSMSPCLKNSSMHLEVHWWCRSHLLAGWDTSQVWRSKLSTRDLSKLNSEWLGEVGCHFTFPLPASINCTLHQVFHLLQLREMHWHVWNAKQVPGQIKMLKSYYQYLAPSLSQDCGTLWSLSWTCCLGCCTRSPSWFCVEEKMKS